MIDQYGFVFINVDIKPKSGLTMEAVPYKVDTGANCTTINYSRLYQLGFDEAWIKSGRLLTGEARPTVASGVYVEDCYQVTLPEIHIGDYVGYNWPFITSLNVDFKFLLGTDSLRFFNWTFDYENNVCRFELIPGKREILFNQAVQSIHAVDEADRG
jgi:hypothetical protein